MPRIQQGSAVRGSQKWIQKLVNERPDLLNSLIRTQLGLPSNEEIHWLSPIAEDGYVMGDVGAADKAAIQLVKVQPYQLLVSDT